MIANDDLIRASGCACELRAQGLPMELLPVAVEDAERLSVALPGVQPELWYTVVKQLGGEIEIAKSAKTFLATHDKYERKVARALHGVMLEMLDDVKRRMIDWQTYEPSRLLPYEKWWKRAQEATVDTLVEAAHEAGKETLRRYNRRIKGRRRPVRKDLVNESDLFWEADGTVLIDIPPTADVSMRAGALETMDKHYWKKWEGTTRAMVWGKIQSGLRNHLSLMEISDSMDDAWPFDFKRAMLVSRTETTMAMNAGHYVMGGQLIADPLSAVNGRQWLSILDVDTRATHTAANKQKIVKTPKGWHVVDGGKVIASGQLFVLGGVHRARFPGDPNLPAKERCNCILPGQEAVGLFDGAMRSFYDGDAIEIETTTGHVVRLTENHPVFTEYGLVPAGQIKEGDQLLEHEGVVEGFCPAPPPDNSDAPFTVEQIYQSLSLVGYSKLARSTPHDLHGDAKRLVNGNIDVVWADRELLDSRNSKHQQFFSKSGLVCVDVELPYPSRSGLLKQLVERSGSSPAGLPGRRALPFYRTAVAGDGLPLYFFGSGSSSELDALLFESQGHNVASHPERLGNRVYRFPFQVSGGEFLDVTYGNPPVLSTEGMAGFRGAEHNASFQQVALDKRRGTLELLGNRQQGFPRFIKAGEVIRVKRFAYRGHVFDLQSASGYIIVQGVVVRNCRCTIVELFNDKLPSGGGTPPPPPDEVAPTIEDAPVSVEPAQDLNAPGLQIAPEERLAQAISRGEADLAGRKKEKVFVYGPDGTVRSEVSGAVDHIDLNQDQIDMMRGAITMHNHPHDSSFSVADIQGGILRQEAESRVVSKRYRFIVNYDNQSGFSMEQREKLQEQLGRTYNAAVKFHAKKAANQVRSGAVSSQAAVDEISHQAWTIAAKKHNLKYTRELLDE